MQIYQMILSYIKSNDSEYEYKLIGISEGLRKNDVKEIENMLYSCKINDINESISFLKLKSGRYCLCCIKPYKSTYGGYNYAAHVLIVDEGYFPFYPVMMYKSPVFKDLLKKMESEKMMNLPVLRDIPSGSDISFESISNFIKQSHELNIKNIISACVNCAKDGGNIILEGKDDDIMHSIAAVQMAFPVKIAHDITFTLSFSNKEDFMILGETSSRDCNSDTEFSYIFKIGEPINNISLECYKFTHIIELGYLVSKQNIDVFHSFFNCFNYNRLDQGIEDAYSIFTIIKTGIGEMKLDSIRSAVEFAREYGTSEGYRQVLIQISKIIDKISREINLENAEMVLPFFYKAAKETNSAFFLDRVYDLLFKSIYNLVFGSSGRSMPEVEALYKDVIQLDKDIQKGFAKYLISPKRIEILVNYLPIDKEAMKSEFYLKIITNSLIGLEYSWKKAVLVEGFVEFLDICIDNITTSKIDYEDVLNVLSGDEEYFANIFVMIYHKLLDTGDLVKNFSDILKVKDDIWCLRVRKILKTLDYGMDILLKEFTIRLEGSEDAVKYFEEYYERVFYEIPDYRSNYYEKAFKIYLEHLTDEDKSRGSLNAIKHIISDNIIIEDSILTSAIKKFEEGIDLSAPDEEVKKFIPVIRNIKNTRKIKTTPDIAKLMDFAIWIEGLEKSSDSAIDEFINEEIDLNDMDDKRYRQYVNWCLPVLIGFCTSPEDHRIIIRAFNITDDEGQFFLEYMRLLEELLKRENLRGYEILLSFMIYYFFYFEPKYKLQGDEILLEKVTNKIIEILSGQSKSWLKSFSSDIKSEFSQKGLSIPIQWNEICSRVSEKQNKSFFSRILEILGKG